MLCQSLNLKVGCNFLDLLSPTMGVGDHSALDFKMTFVINYEIKATFLQRQPNCT